MMNIQQAIKHLVEHNNLSEQQMIDVMHTIMQGQATDAQIAGFIVALRMKGETIDELTGAVKVMRELATPVNTQANNIIDIVGTGGDGLNTFNISTAVSFVVAAAGGIVAKHGNRSASGNSGSADLLEFAGFNINLNSQQVAHCIETLGIGFMFCPMHHSAARHAMAPRKELNIRTLFNVIGPLANPAQAKHQLLGVYSQHWMKPLAETLKQLHAQHVMIVHSQDGMDEISIAAPTDVIELRNGEILEYTFNPKKYGFELQALDSILVKNAKQSLAIINKIFQNESGPARDIVVLNAAAALYTADVCDNYEDALEKAIFALSSGAALEKFNALKQLTHEISQHASIS